MHRFLLFTLFGTVSLLGDTLAPSLVLAHSSSEIDSLGDLGNSFDAVVDAAGRTHVVYSFANPDGGEGLKYAIQEHPGEFWTSSTMYGSTGTAVRSQVSLAVDKLGTLHLSYHFHNATRDELVYASMAHGAASFTGGTLQDASNDSLARTSIDITPDGRPAIAFSNPLGEAAITFRNPDNTWTTEAVSIGADTGFFTSLDTAAIPWAIAYYDGNLEDLRFSIRGFFGATPFWVSSTIDPLGDSGGGAALNRQPDGSFGIAYFRDDAGTETIQLASLPAGQSLWATECATLIEGSFIETGNIDLEFDAVGKPLILWTQVISPTQYNAFMLYQNHKGEFVRDVRGGAGESSVALTVNGAGVLTFIHVTKDDPNQVLTARRIVGRLSRWTCADLDSPLYPAVQIRGASSLAVGPDGTNYAFVGVDAGVSSLVIEKNGELTTLPLANGATYRRSQTLVGADGLVHVFAARSGALEHFAVDPAASSFTVTTISTLVDPAKQFGIARGPDGNLWTAFCRVTGSVEVREAPVDESAPTGFNWTAGGAQTGLTGDNAASIAIGANGHAYVCTLTNAGAVFGFDFHPGGLAGQILADQSAGGTSLPFSQVVLLSGKAYYVFSQRSVGGTDTLFIRDIDGSDLVPAFGAAGELSALRALSFDGASLDLVWRSKPTNLAPRIRHRRLLVGAQSLINVFVDSGEHSFDNDPSTGGLSASHDHNGFLRILSDFRDTTNGYYETVLCQTINGLDHDFDGIPLLVENAFCLDPHSSDSFTWQAMDFLGPLPGGEVLVVNRFQYPDLGTPQAEGNIFVLGEFLYGVHGSDGITPFESIPGTGFSRVGSPVPGTRIGNIGRLYDSAFQAITPTWLQRLVVERIHP